MKVIFMGTPEFSVGALNALVEAKHEVVLVVTQPDKPKGRGERMQEPPVKIRAKELGIPVFQPKRIRDEKEREVLKGYDAEVMVVIAFGQILPQEILDMTPYGCINIHASLLPAYRGAAPIQWAILNGECKTGVTTMQMDAGLDTGDMIQKREVEITPEETGGSLHDKLAQVGADLIVETLSLLEAKEASWEKQPEVSTTPYARMLEKSMGEIDWKETAVEIERKIRGLSPWPGAFTKWEEKILKLWKARVVEKDTMFEQEVGTFFCKENHRLFVKTGEGVLEILELQLAGKKRMKSEDFLRGIQRKPSK